jgi:hypothetical protein
MNCEKAKELIFSGMKPSEMLEVHIASCPECRNLASDWASLKNIRPTLIAEPSRNLDFKIRGAAAAFLDNKKIQHKVFVRRIFMYATAACCVFVTWLALDSIDNESKTPSKSFISSGKIPWSKIDMEKEFLDLTAELDSNIRNIYSNSNAENRNEKDIEISIPDLST